MAIKKKTTPKSNGNRPRNGRAPSKNHVAADAFVRHPDCHSTDHRTYSIPDLRQEHPHLTVRQAIEKEADGTDHLRYQVTGTVDAPVPPGRDSIYLSKHQASEIYRFMLLNRKMEVPLEILYKQGKVVG